MGDVVEFPEPPAVATCKCGSQTWFVWTNGNAGDSWENLPRVVLGPRA